MSGTVGAADPKRDRLAAAQAELVRALADGDAAGDAPPPGFRGDRLRATTDALASKRARAVARTWPGLAGALGGEFREWFTGYARTDPLPPAGGPLADGRAFARTLARAGRLPDEGRVEALAVDLRYKRCRAGSSGLAPRSRGSFVLRTAVLARPRRRLILAARLPLLGERWLTLPL